MSGDTDPSSPSPRTTYKGNAGQAQPNAPHLEHTSPGRLTPGLSLKTQATGQDSPHPPRVRSWNPSLALTPVPLGPPRPKPLSTGAAEGPGQGRIPQSPFCTQAGLGGGQAGLEKSQRPGARTAFPGAVRGAETAVAGSAGLAPPVKRPEWQLTPPSRIHNFTGTHTVHTAQLLPTAQRCTSTPCTRTPSLPSTSTMQTHP